jgi:hypothetical protein
MSTITIILKPALRLPMLEGSIQIIVNNNTPEITNTKYTTDPEIILSWCPFLDP